jgi:hypothetical protein
MSKSQQLTVLTVNKHYIQLLLFWFHFLDLLIKFMKMRLLYILYCGEREETGVTPPHAGWQRTQKILVFVVLIPHMQNNQGQNHPCFFVTFFILSNS